jgi:hypothetical protein
MVAEIRASQPIYGAIYHIFYGQYVFLIVPGTQIGLNTVPLEHDPERWKPVFGKDHAQTQNLGRDPIQSNWITV